jgi:hypothetical protein
MIPPSAPSGNRTDLDWRVELSDAGSKVRQPGPGVPRASTLGQEMTHPDLFLAEPSLRDLPFYRTPGTAYHKPPEGNLGPEIGVNNNPNRSARDQTLHEVSHELARLNGWPRGGSPREFADGQPLAYLRLPGESPQDAYLRMLGERESNVVVKRAEMTQPELQAETPEQTMARSRGRFPPGPSIRLAFGKQRSLGDFDKLERQGFLREQARARQDQQAAKPVSDAIREQLSREDALGDKADKVALQAATLVQNMKAAGIGPNEIAAQLQHQFGTPVNPADVASGQGWWSVGASPAGGLRWTPEEKALLASLYQQGKSYADIAQGLKDSTGRDITNSTVSVRRRDFGIPARSSMQTMWPREANLMLAQLAEKGATTADMASQLSRAFGQGYTPRQIGQQIDRLRLGARDAPNAPGASWQPDAVALLTSPQAQGMTAQQLADLIYRETGQVTSKGAVLGKLDRLRAEKARQELAEDLARVKATTLRATGVPLTGWDALTPEDDWRRQRAPAF